MSANPSEPTEQESNIPLDDLIKKLADTVEKLTDVIVKAQKATKANNSLSADWHKYQSLMKLEQEKEHGRQVRLNKEYGRSQASLQMFTGLLTKGASAGLIFNRLAGHIGGVSKELDKLKTEQQELNRMNAKYQKQFGDNWRTQDANKAEAEMVRKQEARVGDAQEASKGKTGKLAEGISSMKEFADKHKTGILIGAGSIGILLTVLKKAFDVSPMFQAIKKLLHFGFMLILRPIGDFFGFIMRPIMVMMLRKFIIPWYKDVYPVMKKWGTAIGNWVAGAAQAAGDPATIAAVAIGSAGVIAAIYVVAKKITIGLSTSVVKGVLANLGVKLPVKVPPLSSPVPKFKIPPPPKAPVIKIPPVIAKVATKIAAIPAVITNAVKAPIKAVSIATSNIMKNVKTVSNIIPKVIKDIPLNLGKGVNAIKNVVTPVVKNLASPKTAAAAADALKIVKTVAKPLTRIIPIAGQVLLAIDAAGSAMKHFAPEQYEGVRQAALGIGAAFGDTEGTVTEQILDFGGFGKQSTMEQVAGGVGWAKDKLGITTGGSGIGGGSRDARSANNIIVNIGTVNENADALVVTQTISNELAKQNKKSPRT